MFRLLFDAIEMSQKGTTQEQLMPSLYRGTTVSKIICLSCKNSIEHEEEFQDIQLMVKGHPDLLSSFENYVNFDKLEGTNQYFCEKCNQKNDALKGNIFRKLPPILICVLNRFDFDWNEVTTGFFFFFLFLLCRLIMAHMSINSFLFFIKNKRKKLNEHFPFPLVVDLSPYTETYKAKEDVEMNSNNIPKENQPSHEQMPEVQKEEISHKSTNLFATAANWEDTVGSQKLYQPDIANPNSDDLYQLFAVVVHSGGAYGGHYHALIRDLEKRDSKFTMNQPEPRLDKLLENLKTDSGQWYDFNDAKVTPVSLHQLVNQYGEGKECAYMLYYRKISLSVEPFSHTLIPKFLRSLIETENERLQKEREEYYTAVNSIQLVITTPSYYILNEDSLFYKFEPDSTTDQLAASETAEQQEKRGVYRFIFDQREPFSKLLKEIGQKLHWIEPLCLTEIKHRSNKIVVVKNFEVADVSLSGKEAGLRHKSDILAWNGKDINEVPWKAEIFKAQPSKPTHKPKIDKAEGEYEIWVEDHLTGLGTFPVEANKDSSIIDLKQNALAKIKTTTGNYVDQEKVKLSKYQNKDSNILISFADEGLTLEQAGILDGTKLILEEGEPPTQVLHLYFKVTENGKITTQSPLEISIHKRSSVLDW